VFVRLVRIPIRWTESSVGSFSTERRPTLGITVALGHAAEVSERKRTNVMNQTINELDCTDEGNLNVGPGR